MKNISDKGKKQMRFNFTLQEGGIRSYSTKLNVFQMTIGAEQLFCKIPADGYFWFKFLAPAPARASNVQN